MKIPWFGKRARVLSENPFGFLSSSQTASKKNVNPETAMAVATVFRCVNVLASTLACLPCIMYRRLPGGGKERATDHPLHDVLRYRPNSYSTAVNFFESMMISNAMRGNSFANVVRNGAGQIVDLHYLEPERVVVELAPSADRRFQKIYHYTAQSGSSVVLRQDEVLHVTALVARGVLGISPIDYARETIGLAMISEEHGARSFANAARPVGIITHPGPGGLSAAAKENLKASWFNQAGGEAAYGTPILEHGLKYDPIQLTNEQSQFIESRKFQVTEICRWFGVPPHMAMDLERATFSNIEHQFLEFLFTCMLPWFVRFEQSIWGTLLTEAERKEYFVEFLPDAMLRGDTLTRNNAYQIARQGGWMSVDEIREKENMNPLPDGKGKIYLEPLNMKEAGKEVEPTPTEAQTSPQPTSDDSPLPSPSQEPERSNVAEVMQHFRPLVDAAIKRAMVKEVNAMRDGGKKERKVEQFYAGQTSLMREALLPLVQTAAQVSNTPDPAEVAESIVGPFIAEYSERSITALRADPDCACDWLEKRLATEVETLMAKISSSFSMHAFEAKHPTAVRNIVQLQPIVNVEQKPIVTNVTVEQPDAVVEAEMRMETDESGGRVYKFRRVVKGSEA